MSWNGAESRTLPAPVRLFLCINIALGCVAAVFVWFCRHHHLPEPYRTPYIPSAAYYDLTAYSYRFVHFHKVSFFSHDPKLAAFFQYPAPVALIYKALYSANHVLRLFVVSTVGPLAVAAMFFIRRLISTKVSAGSAIMLTVLSFGFSFPFWFEYRLGNLEIYVFLLVAAAVACYLRGYFFASAILIGIATSMKIFPGVYFALFLSRKQFRQLSVGVFTVAASNLFSLWVLGPSIRIAWRGISEGLALNREHYMLHFLPVETSFDHSVFGLIKRLFFATGTGEVPSSVLSMYLFIVAIGGVLLYFLRLRYLPVTNQVLCLCIVSILLPPTSHDYTLIHLYTPLAMLVIYAAEQKNRSSSCTALNAIFACMAVLCSPEPEAIHSGAAFSAQIKCLALIVLLALVCWHRLPDPGLDESGADPSSPLGKRQVSV